ncbi:MAG TPA: hypothetical protein VFW19_11045 [Allosphingosinicella sp.]|nr:hypothetical protein [Allosphingosinicella sp.]
MKIPSLKTIVLATAFVAAPLAAQSRWDSTTFWAGAPAGVWERIGFMQHRIDAGVARHKLNRTEATRAQNELGRIREMTRNMRARDGGTLNETDRTYLQDRLDHLGNDIHWMAHNGW